MEYILLSSLSTHRQNYKIKVRICRIWESTAPFLKGDIFSLDCLLIDEANYSMQATIRKQDAEDLRPLLEEGNIYVIEKFNVIQSKKRFIAVSRAYMIQINKWTNITPLEDDIRSIPLYNFNFSSFSEVEAKRNSDSVLTDVIGQIVSIGEVNQRYVQQTLTFIRTIVIQDLEENQLSVTLWDKFASYFHDNDFREKQSKGPIIAILAGMTIRTFQEKVHLSTCSASKIYLNLEIPEVSTFENRVHSIIKQVEWIPADNKQVISPQEEMSLNRQTIAELLDIQSVDPENVKYTCEATIIDIDTSYGWWYKSCSSCRAAVKTSDDTIGCHHCGENNQSPVPWYKLNTVVEDATGIACFTIFGRLAQELVHFPAKQLATMATSDQFTIPTIIKTIIGQKHIFQITSNLQHFRTGLTSFKVTKIFTINYNLKGKRLAMEPLLIKNEEDFNPSVEACLSSDLLVQDIAKNAESSDPFGENKSEISNLSIQPSLSSNISTESVGEKIESSVPFEEKISEISHSPPTKRHCIGRLSRSTRHK